MTRAACLLPLLLLAAACSTALSTAQTAETLPKGGWHVGAGMDVNLPVTRVADAIDAAYQIQDKLRDDPGYVPTDDDKQRYADAAIGLALSQPGVGMDLMLRYGLLHRVDVGLRYTTTGIHLDGKLQFLDRGAWDGSVSLGYANHSFDGLIFDLLDLVQINDFSRHDLEVPVILGRRLGDHGHLWFGPKAIVAFVSVDATLAKLDETLTTSDTIYYLGGFAGASLGYRWVEVFAELTIMDMLATPTILGRERDLGGIVVMPTAGMMVRW